MLMLRSRHTVELSCMQRVHATKLHRVLDPLHAIYCMQLCFKQAASLEHVL